MAFLFILGILAALLIGWEMNERLMERKRLAEQCLKTIGLEIEWVHPQHSYLSNEAGQRRFRRLNLGLIQDGIDHLKASPVDFGRVIPHLQALQRTVLRAQWKMDKGKMTDEHWQRDMEQALSLYNLCLKAMKPQPSQVLRSWVGL